MSRVSQLPQYDSRCSGARGTLPRGTAPRLVGKPLAEMERAMHSVACRGFLRATTILVFPLAIVALRLLRRAVNPTIPLRGSPRLVVMRASLLVRKWEAKRRVVNQQLGTLSALGEGSMRNIVLCGDGT